jgi:uncharacterized protein (DUF1697 family)
MTAYVGLLRAVNVGGTKLLMTDLRALGEAAGFANVRTYIASGNLLFESPLAEVQVKQALERRLLAHMGKPVRVMIRTDQEMAQVVAANPFRDTAPNRTVAIFLDTPPPADLMAGVTHQTDEEIAAGGREIYVHYGDGMGTSKLKIRAAKDGTARNMNTVAALAGLARAG